MTTFTAVAINFEDRILFGPNFNSEDDAWEWLHSPEDILVPVHQSIEVMQQP